MLVEIKNDFNVNFHASCNRICQQLFGFLENSSAVYAGTIIISLRKFLLAEQAWQIHRKKEHVARMNAQRVRSKKI